MDKQDKLAKIIHAGIWPDKADRPRTSLDACRDIAAAVRSFMGSEEVVRRAGNALQEGWSFADDAGLHALPDIELSSHEREHLARAALSAAIDAMGGDRG